MASNEEIANRMVRVGQLAENLQYFYRLESETDSKLIDLRQDPWAPPSKNAPKTVFTPVGFALPPRAITASFEGGLLRSATIGGSAVIVGEGTLRL